LTPVADKQTKS
jgi:peptidylprolyl isomerase